MKKLFIFISVLLVSISASGTRYYFSSKNGSDANTGTSSGQAWETVAKFRTTLALLNPGDTVSFDASCTWDEFYADIDNIDGSYGSPIVFNSYGEGRRPVLKGTKDYSGTLSESGELWSISGDADIDTIQFPNIFRQIWIDSVYYEPSRYPNSGFLTCDGGSLNQMADLSESWSSNEHAGGVCVGYFTAWEWTQGLIFTNNLTSLQFVNVLSYEDGGHTVTPGSGDYYFILGSPSTNATDQDGENYFTTDGFSIYWAADNLNTHVVECTTVDTMFHITNSEHLKFEGLVFEKVNQYTFVLNDCENITIDNCGFNWSNGGHIRGHLVDTMTIQNNFFHETQNGTFFFTYSGMIKNQYNDYKNICVRDGLRNLNTRYNAINTIERATDSIIFQYNVIDSVSSVSNQHWSEYLGIPFAVKYYKNTVVHYGWSKLGDNGGFYNGGEWDSRIPKIFQENVMINSGVNNTYNYGTSPQEFFHAFYNDYNSAGSRYLGNTIFNANMIAYINGGDNGSGYRLRFENNLSYNAARDMQDQWGNLFNMVNATGNIYPRNDTIRYNTFVFGNNSNERVYALSDYEYYGSVAIPFKFDYNNILDPFTYSNPDIYRDINNFSVTANYDISELCSIRGQDCNSTFNTHNWDYGDVSSTYSEGEFVIPVWNGTDTAWYFDLGDCTVLDAETGDTYTDSVQISGYDGKVLMMVSGTRASIGDTAHWNPPVTWFEFLNDTSFVAAPPAGADTCDAHYTVYDTVTVMDSVIYYFESNLNDGYGSRNLTVDGTAPNYSALGVCQGSTAIYPEFNGDIYSPSINLGNNFHIRFCYTHWGSNTGTLLANRGNGSGWELNRGDGECLEFVTSDGTNLDTVQSSAYAIGVNGTTYDIDVTVDVVGGTVSFKIDDVYDTGSDSLIQSDFEVSGPIFLNSDANGNNDAFTFYDSLQIDWSYTSITSYDSCIQYGAATLLDTLFPADADTFSMLNPTYTVESVCGADSTLLLYQHRSFIAFRNINFDTMVVNRLYIAAIDNSDIKLQVRLDNEQGIIVGEFTENNATCNIQEITISNITGTHDVYITAYNSGGLTPGTPRFAWVFFDYVAIPPSKENIYVKIEGYRILNGRKIVIW